MLKQLLIHMDIARFGEIGLVIFFVVFVAVTVWAISRSRRDVEQWSAIPLENTHAANEERVK